MVILPSPIQISGKAPDTLSAAGKSKYSISISIAAATFQALSNSFVFLTNRRSLNNYGNFLRSCDRVA